MQKKAPIHKKDHTTHNSCLPVVVVNKKLLTIWPTLATSHFWQIQCDLFPKYKNEPFPIREKTWAPTFPTTSILCWKRLSDLRKLHYRSVLLWAMQIDLFWILQKLAYSTWLGKHHHHQEYCQATSPSICRLQRVTWNIAQCDNYLPPRVSTVQRTTAYVKFFLLCGREGRSMNASNFRRFHPDRFWRHSHCSDCGATIDDTVL